MSPGDWIILCYSGSDSVLGATLADISNVEKDLRRVAGFAGCVAGVPPSNELEQRLEAAGYRMPEGREHTALVLKDVRHAPYELVVEPPEARNAIWRMTDASWAN